MCAASGHGYLSPASLGLRNHVCVLPCGGLSPHDMNPWTASDLAPYVRYARAGKPSEPMFGGFIFHGIAARPGRFIYPMYIAFGLPSDQEDWLQWIDDLFAPGRNLNALASETDRPLDVWISIPYPHPLQTAFGKVDGTMLNFQSEADRCQAVEWWIDQFTDRFHNEGGFCGKLDLRGFLWQRESIDASDEPLVKRTNQYVSSKGYRSMWLPQYGGYGALKFAQLGFDAAAVHANYYGNTGYGVEWIDQAALFARVCGAGFQIICGKGVLYSDTHLLDYLNHGLPDQNGYMTEAFLVYQFPNQRLRDVLRTRPADYDRLHAFMKGTYAKVPYPGIAY